MGPEGQGNTRPRCALPGVPGSGAEEVAPTNPPARLRDGPARPLFRTNLVVEHFRTTEIDHLQFHVPDSWGSDSNAQDSGGNPTNGPDSKYPKNTTQQSIHGTSDCPCSGKEQSRWGWRSKQAEERVLRQGSAPSRAHHRKTLPEEHGWDVGPGSHTHSRTIRNVPAPGVEVRTPTKVDTETYNLQRALDQLAHEQESAPSLQLSPIMAESTPPPTDCSSYRSSGPGRLHQGSAPGPPPVSRSRPSLRPRSKLPDEPAQKLPRSRISQQSELDEEEQRRKLEQWSSWLAKAPVDVSAHLRDALLAVAKSLVKELQPAATQTVWGDLSDICSESSRVDDLPAGSGVHEHCTQCTTSISPWSSNSNAAMGEPWQLDAAELHSKVSMTPSVIVSRVSSSSGPSNEARCVRLDMLAPPLPSLEEDRFPVSACPTCLPVPTADSSGEDVRGAPLSLSSLESHAWGTAPAKQIYVMQGTRDASLCLPEFSARSSDDGEGVAHPCLSTCLPQMTTVYSHSLPLRGQYQSTCLPLLRSAGSSPTSTLSAEQRVSSPHAMVSSRSSGTHVRCGSNDTITEACQLRGRTIHRISDDSSFVSSGVTTRVSHSARSQELGSLQQFEPRPRERPPEYAKNSALAIKEPREIVMVGYECQTSEPYPIVVEKESSHLSSPQYCGSRAVISSVDGYPSSEMDPIVIMSGSISSARASCTDVAPHGPAAVEFQEKPFLEPPPPLVEQDIPPKDMVRISSSQNFEGKDVQVMAIAVVLDHLITLLDNFKERPETSRRVLLQAEVARRLDKLLEHSQPQLYASVSTKTRKFASSVSYWMEAYLLRAEHA